MNLSLMLGPEGVEDAPSIEQLERGWRVFRGELMSKPHPVLGVRPWAYWAFDLGEDEPVDRDERVVRLAELGLLEPEELAELQERAVEARLRLETLANIDVLEHQRVVRLWERVGATVAGR